MTWGPKPNLGPLEVELPLHPTEWGDGRNAGALARAAEGDSTAEVVAVCKLCGTVRCYDLADKSEQMVLGGTCPGTSPEPV